MELSEIYRYPAFVSFPFQLFNTGLDMKFYSIGGSPEPDICSSLDDLRELLTINSQYD